jgi:hypothetical protein
MNKNTIECDGNTTFQIDHITKLDQGKQGVTGLLTLDGVKYVYKMSQYMNYLTFHEHLVMKNLNEMWEYCPHFCSVYDNKHIPVNPNFRIVDNPFDLSECSIPLTMNVLLMEYIEGSIPFLQLIETADVPFGTIMSVIKQTLLSVMIGQKYKKFVHYDLHSMNILMKVCEDVEVHLYRIDEENTFCVPTYGYYPVIIDFGFSRSQAINNNPSYCSLAYTDAGYMTPGYDPLADPKIFLVSVAEDFKEYRDTEETNKFRNVVKNLFRPLNIDWSSGWDIECEPPVVDQLFNYIENVNEKSELLRKYPHFCMDILQSLIILPLKPVVEPDLRELRKAYRVFVHEFFKIEDAVHNLFYSLYIFRCIIDSARELCPLYMSDPNVVITFKRDIFESIRKVVQFCEPKHVDYEKMLCSLYVFREQFDTQLFYLLKRTMTKKFDEYSKLDIQSVQQMFGVFDINFPSEFVFTEQTVIKVWDCCNQCNEAFSIPPEYVDIVNKLEPYCRGQFLHDIYREYQSNLGT